MGQRKRYYRIIEFKVPKTNEIWYEVQRQRNFLWWSWWTLVYEDYWFSNSSPMLYMDIKEAERKLAELENTYNN